MVSFWEFFYVPQNELPEDTYLKVYIFINVLEIIFVSIVAFVVIYKIKSSVSGPVSQINQPIPTPLFNSIFWIFFSLILIIVNNLIARLYPMLTSNQGYVLIGFKSLSFMFGMPILLYGIMNFTLLLSNKRDRYANISFTIFIILSLSVISSNILVTLNESFLFRQFWNYLIPFTSIFATIFFLYTAFVIIYGSESYDSISHLRLQMVWIFLIFTFLFLLSLILFLPRGDDPRLWPTRNPSVEVLFIFKEVYVIVTSLLIYLIVDMPVQLRSLFGISIEEYRRNRDYRFDYKWTHTSNILVNEAKFSKTKNTSQPIIVYTDNTAEDTARDISRSLSLDYLSEEETKSIIARNFDLLTNDVILISSKVSPLVEECLSYIEDKFHRKIELQKDNSTIQINGNYTIRGDDFRLALCTIIPSKWNFSNRMWWFHTSKRLSQRVCEHIIDFYDYYRSFDPYRLHFSILQFPLVKGFTRRIPSIFGERNIPDPNYVIIF